MKLTKKKALEIAIELWGWIVDNPGKNKNEWPEWEKYGEMRYDCPLCEVGHFEVIGDDNLLCDCPLAKYNSDCFEWAYGKWERAMDAKKEDGGHAAAVEFLAQLKGIAECKER